MAKVVGLVNLHSDVSYEGLTERRPVASVSFLGRYGIIDFVLSNMSNSNVDTVGVLIKDVYKRQFHWCCRVHTSSTIMDFRYYSRIDFLWYLLYWILFIGK